MTQLEDTLRHVAGDLAAFGVRFALIGGLAVSIRSEPRFTRDADLAVAVAAADAEPLEVLPGLMIPVARVGQTSVRSFWPPRTSNARGCAAPPA